VWQALKKPFLAHLEPTPRDTILDLSKIVLPVLEDSTVTIIQAQALSVEMEPTARLDLYRSFHVLLDTGVP